MNRQLLIKKTLENISLLPDWRLKEVSDYVDFLSKISDDKKLVEDLRNIVSQTKSFHFLEDEEELYTDSDLTQKY
jgi:hypothetical protein